MGCEAAQKDQIAQAGLEAIQWDQRNSLTIPLINYYHMLPQEAAYWTLYPPPPWLYLCSQCSATISQQLTSIPKIFEHAQTISRRMMKLGFHAF
jgi:hypothetical protein